MDQLKRNFPVVTRTVITTAWSGIAIQKLAAAPTAEQTPWWLGQVYLDQKPALWGKQIPPSAVSRWGIFSCQQPPGPRCTADAPGLQRSQTETGPGRCSVQTYPRSATGRSSPKLMKTFRAPNQRSGSIRQLSGPKFKNDARHTRQKRWQGDILSVLLSSKLLCIHFFGLAVQLTPETEMFGNSEDKIVIN